MARPKKVKEVFSAERPNGEVETFATEAERNEYLARTPDASAV